MRDIVRASLALKRPSRNLLANIKRPPVEVLVIRQLPARKSSILYTAALAYMNLRLTTRETAMSGVVTHSYHQGLDRCIVITVPTSSSTGKPEEIKSKWPPRLSY